ncbi:MAG: glycosyltransferase family 2 protein [Terriglobales bacterium]
MADTYTLVAPAGTRGRPWPFQGRLARKPWEFRVSACIPHLGTPAELAVVIETLRWQTVAPYIIVVDTGSPPAVCAELELLRSDDVEIHYVRSHGYRHPSEPVAVALDLAHAVCHTEHLYHTHSDVFIRRVDWLEWLLARCSADCPVVGYEMSERSGHEEWRGTVSHTATMLHMPTMRRIGATWNMQSWYETRGVPVGALGTWPDTESMLRLSLDRAGITPLFVGPDTCPGAAHERNYTRDIDLNVDHVRSFPSHQLYHGPVGMTAAAEMPAAMAEAMARVAEWRRLSDSRLSLTE